MLCLNSIETKLRSAWVLFSGPRAHLASVSSRPCGCNQMFNFNYRLWYLFSVFLGFKTNCQFELQGHLSILNCSTTCCRTVFNFHSTGCRLCTQRKSFPMHKVSCWCVKLPNYTGGSSTMEELLWCGEEVALSEGDYQSDVHF